VIAFTDRQMACTFLHWVKEHSYRPIRRQHGGAQLTAAETTQGSGQTSSSQQLLPKPDRRTEQQQEVVELELDKHHAGILSRRCHLNGLGVMLVSDNCSWGIERTLMSDGDSCLVSMPPTKHDIIANLENMLCLETTGGL
jgi:hypothetical protein